MKNFEYYGLFLTEESKTKLKAWLWENDYDIPLVVCNTQEMSKEIRDVL